MRAPRGLEWFDVVGATFALLAFGVVPSLIGASFVLLGIGIVGYAAFVGLPGISPLDTLMGAAFGLFVSLVMGYVWLTPGLQQIRKNLRIIAQRHPI